MTVVVGLSPSGAAGQCQRVPQISSSLNSKDIENEIANEMQTSTELFCDLLLVLKGMSHEQTTTAVEIYLHIDITAQYTCCMNR